MRTILAHNGFDVEEPLEHRWHVVPATRHLEGEREVLVQQQDALPAHPLRVYQPPACDEGPWDPERRHQLPVQLQEGREPVANGAVVSAVGQRDADPVLVMTATAVLASDVGVVHADAKRLPPRFARFARPVLRLAVRLLCYRVSDRRPLLRPARRAASDRGAAAREERAARRGGFVLHLSAPPTRDRPCTAALHSSA
eukprot:2847265-Prymnesium_polylepis.1